MRVVAPRGSCLQKTLCETTLSREYGYAMLRKHDMNTSRHCIAQAPINKKRCSYYTRINMEIETRRDPNKKVDFGRLTYKHKQLQPAFARKVCFCARGADPLRGEVTELLED